MKLGVADYGLTVWNNKLYALELHLNEHQIKDTKR